MSSEFRRLKGRTGVIKKILSHREAVIRDNVYNDIIFTSNVVKFSMQEKENDFTKIFSINKHVYYDLEIIGDTVKCVDLWLGRKCTLEETNLRSWAIDSTPCHTADDSPTLRENTTYKATVTNIRAPFVCIAKVNDTNIPVFIFNCSFKPTHNSPKLKREEPLICFLKRGDTVYVRVYRCESGKEFEWAAWDAWKEDITVSEKNETIKCVDRRTSINFQAEERKQTGKLTFVSYKTGHLENSKYFHPVIFHRENTFLHGVPLKNVGLDRIFTKGDELNFALSEVTGEVICVWVGSFGERDDSAEVARTRVNDLIKYCQHKGIEDRTIIVKLFLDFGKQCNPFNIDNTNGAVDVSDDLASRIQGKYEEKVISSLDSLASRINPVKSKRRKVNPTVETSDNLVQFSSTTDSSVVSNESSSYKTASKTGEFSGKLISSETECPIHLNKLSYHVAVSPNLVQEEEMEILATNNFIPKKRSQFELDVKEIECFARTKGNEGVESDFSDHIHQRTDLEKTSFREKEVILGQSSETKEMESEFGVPLLNKHLMHILEKSLLSVLKKEVGENASLILVPHAMSRFTKALEEYAVQELMKKVFSLIIDDQPLEGKDQQNVSNATKKNKNRKKKMQKLAQEWREESRIIAEDEKIKDKQFEVKSRAGADQHQEKVSSFLATISENEVYESDDSECNIDTELCEGNGQLNMVGNSVKLQKEQILGIGNTTEHKLKEVAEKGIQTASTGPVLHLTYLPEL